MATVTTETNNLRYTFGLKNGKTRYVDIENPITDTGVIATNVTALNAKVSTGGAYEGIMVDADFYNGDTDAVVVSVTKAEVIKVTKTTDTTAVYYR